MCSLCTETEISPELRGALRRSFVIEHERSELLERSCGE
jgi:hypothetical protein